jgi:Tfp pilus assembly protein PilO
MKDLVNKLITKAHILLFVYGLYGAYVMYDEHSIQLAEIENTSTTVDAEIIETKKKVKEIQEFIKKADEYKVRVEEVAKNIESVQKQLPSETNDTQILTYLQSEINALNIKDAKFTPGKEFPSTYFISKDYTLKGRGTFLQFLIFFERIGNADRIYNIKNLTLTLGNESQKGRFQIIDGEGTIQAYRFNPEFKVDRGF